MKPNFALLALLIIPATASVSFADTAPTAENCKMLTANNMSACCNAPNWRDIIPGDMQASCAESNGQKSQKPGAGDDVGSVTSPGEDGGTTTPGTGTDTGDAGGNPGNDSAVGQSGEKGMDGESPSSGTKGSSN